MIYTEGFTLAINGKQIYPPVAPEPTREEKDAARVAAFYKKLVAEGVPFDYAGDLTRDYLNRRMGEYGTLGE